MGGSVSTVLVVDDEAAIRDSIRMVLEYAKFAVLDADNGETALAMIASHEVDLVLLDLKFRKEDQLGMRILERIRERYPLLPVVMITGHGTIESAVEATRLGAFDFLEKPLDNDRLELAARRAIEVKRLRDRVESNEVILGSSPAIADVIASIERVAPTEGRVLITGENGTGKELVARAIHRLSHRRSKPLVEVNCAAIPNELIESELFGHERGAFTGASAQRIGKFEQADGGTLFLDEIGDMSVQAQAKVLRVLEEGKVERLGGNRQIPVDVRIIAASNKDLAAAIRRGEFREDLYHRVNVIPIQVPPLRSRREDIPLLASAFAEQICRQNGMPPKQLSAEALRALQVQDWTGNVRELRNTVERLVIMTPSLNIEYSGGSAPAMRSPSPGLDGLLATELTFKEYKDRTEAAFIRVQLEKNGWNVSKTADALQIQRSHLYNKIRKFGLMRSDQ
jgi:two-component system, NtrC family, nitrogen regulation response regulator NtrX